MTEYRIEHVHPDNMYHIVVVDVMCDRRKAMAKAAGHMRKIGESVYVVKIADGVEVGHRIYSKYGNVTDGYF